MERKEFFVFGRPYYIDENGEIINYHGRKINHHFRTKNKNDYPYAEFRKNTPNGIIRKKILVHRLVAKFFIPNPKNLPQVNHIDGNKGNCHVSNLEWATTAEQNVHGTRLQRARAHTDYRARNIDYSIVASKHDYVKIAKINSRPVKVWDISGDEPIYMGEFPSQKAASDFTGVSMSKVSQCVSGQKKSCKGYTFEEFPIAVTKIRFPD